MEDIPRELERELIARNKPRPVKRARKWDLILLGDTGEMRPVRQIRGLAILFVLIVVTSISGSCGVYYYSRMVMAENNELKGVITDLEIQEKRLRREIDSLVSRYMMESVTLEKGKAQGASSSRKPKKKAASNSRKPEKREPPRKKPAAPKKALSVKKPPPEKAPLPDKKPVNEPSPPPEVAGNIEKTPVPGKRAPAREKTDRPEKKTELFDVAVDDFELSRQRDENSLKVKFIIKNRGKSPQNISGRIFVLLKSHEIEQENWLISPETDLIDGKPADALVGQFFSINRYKTVRLTLSSDRPAEYYKQCTVFVYNEGGSTILEKEFPL